MPEKTKKSGVRRRRPTFNFELLTFAVPLYHSVPHERNESG